MIQDKILTENYYILPKYHSSLVRNILMKCGPKRKSGEDEDEDEDMEGPMMPNDPMFEPDYEVVGSTAVIEINGTLVTGATDEECEYFGLCNYEDIRDQLEDAKEDGRVSNILLSFSSPGGFVQGSDTTAKLIYEINEVKPCVAWTGDLMASAAYKLASQCSAIYASSEAEVGCIGVIFTHYDLSQMYKDAGIQPTIFKSGKYKDMYNQDRPMTDEEKAMAQADVDKLGQEFRDMINRNRSVPQEAMEGLCYQGEEAIAVNLIDGIIEDNDDLTS